MTDIFAKYAGTGLSTLYSQIRQQSETHMEFLDPLCTILKLCVINFKPIGTKISVRDNSINIQDASVFQTLFRTIHNDSREQLFQLKFPIFYFKGMILDLLKHSLNENEECSYKKINLEYLIYMKDIAVSGLKKLRSTYDIDWKNCTIIRNCINDYIRILTMEYTQEQYDKELLEFNKSSMILIYNEFLKLWNDNELEPIIKILKLLDFKCTNNCDYIHSSINSYSNAIDHLIIGKNDEINILRP